MSRRRHLSFFLEEKGYVNQRGSSLADNTYIQSHHINSARLALEADRDALYKNALIAYSSAFKMILSQNYSWAFVHSYYSLVYFYQVLLAFNDISMCYDNGSPFYIKLSSGAQFHKTDGNTHRAVIKLFKREFLADSEVCSAIAGEVVCDWFEDMRNSINYRTVPQNEPRIDHGLYDYKEDEELRKYLSIYIGDLPTYAYTVEHSYVAYPLLLVRRIQQLYCNKGQHNKYLKDDESFIRFLGENFKDKKGKISIVLDLVNEII